MICTVTSASQPILKGSWVRPGTHVNLVGSSHAGPVEADTDLVRTSRYFVDHRPSALAAAAEFLMARKEGAIGDEHIVGEVGDVLNGALQARKTPEDITVYKSLGHIAQDLAAVAYMVGEAAQGLR